MLQPTLASVKFQTRHLIFGVAMVGVRARQLRSKIWPARSGTSMAIDIVYTDILLSLPKKGRTNASVLCEVPCQKGSQKPEEHRHEEWPTSDPGRLSDLRHQGIPNRQVELILRSLTELRRAGRFLSWEIQPFCFGNHT